MIDSHGNEVGETSSFADCGFAMGRSLVMIDGSRASTRVYLHPGVFGRFETHVQAIPFKSA